MQTRKKIIRGNFQPVDRNQYKKTNKEKRKLRYLKFRVVPLGLYMTTKLD